MLDSKEWQARKTDSGKAAVRFPPFNRSIEHEKALIIPPWPVLAEANMDGRTLPLQPLAF